MITGLSLAIDNNINDIFTISTLGTNYDVDYIIINFSSDIDYDYNDTSTSLTLVSEYHIDNMDTNLSPKMGKLL